MIICHKYKFIYIKSMKTAGTSLEIALANFCDENDIISRDEEVEENIKKKLSRGGQNNLYKIPRVSYKNLKHNIFQLIKFILIKFGIKFDHKVKFINCFNKEKFYSHIPAKNVKKMISRNIWDNYYKFTVIRNPIDQIISYYYWCNKSEAERSKNSFDYFIKKHSKEFFSKQKNIYTIENKIIVDKCIVFENFEYELNELSKKLKLPENLFEIFNKIRTKDYVRKNKDLSIANNYKIKNLIKENSSEIFDLHSNFYN